MTRRKLILVPLLLLLALAGAAAGLLWHWRQNQLAKNQLTLHGNVDIRQVDLAFNASGRINRMRAVEGQQVQRGQLLAVLDSARFEHAVAQAKAQVAAQQQVVDKLEAGSRPQEIQQARANVDAAKARVTNARQEYQRDQGLIRQKAVSQSQLDSARAAYDTARAELDSAQQALALALAGPRSEDIAAAKATLDADRAGLALAQQDLTDASLYAPAAGIIQTRILEPGDMASPQRPVYTLALTDPLWVRAYVSEPDLGKIHPGMHAAVTTDSYPGKRYRGWIGYISPTAEFTPKSVETNEVRSALVYQVRVYVCNPQDELRLGMPATVTVALNQPARPLTGNPCPAAQ